MGIMNKKTVTIFLLAVLFCGACEDLDFTGFIRSPDPVNKRVKQSLEWNETHPAREIFVQGSDYDLLVGGDSHVGGTVNLGTFLEQANTTGICGVIMVGDITTGKKEDYVTFNQELDLKCSGPAFMIVGNHDLFFNGWDTFFSFFGSSTYSFTVRTEDATDLYICLDTGGGTLGWRQLEWLKDLLENERKNTRYCVIFTHNNFFREHRTLSTNPLVDELKIIIDLCYTNEVNMVITGHDHKRSEEHLGKTWYVTVDALVDGCNNASYLKLQARESSLGFVFVEL
jgi:3',5'-cyclic AMP phosphodiesterase CpdA